MSIFFTSLLLSLTLSTLVHAALTATTANTIQGTQPYLTFDGGTTRVTTTDGLLGIKLSDGTVFKKSDLTGSNPGTSGNPIELPVAGQKLKDITTLIPVNQTTVTLNDLVNTHGYWGDADGDNMPTVTGGDLKIEAVDANNAPVNLTDTLNACSSPYKVTLTSTAGILSTQYGMPRDTTFTGSSATYYIKPKIGNPYACWAAPNLTNGTAAYISPSHPEWEIGKGFKVPNPLGAANTHFPRTGFHGAFFDITVAGATAADVISATGSSITQGGVTMSLTGPSTNIVRVTLTGPKHPSGGAFSSSTFAIKSGASNTIYNFKLSKWFVAKPGGFSYSAAGNGSGQSTPNYCARLSPSNSYRVPSVSEYTNANRNIWTWGLPGWVNNTYARAIGNGKRKTAVSGDDSKGGLFAEWGHTYGNYVNATYPGYYTSSDFESNLYWAVEQYNSPTIGTTQFIVYPDVGKVNAGILSYAGGRAACVSP